MPIIVSVPNYIYLSTRPCVKHFMCIISFTFYESIFFFFYPYFRAKESEDPRGKETCPGVHTAEKIGIRDLSFGNLIFNFCSLDCHPELWVYKICIFFLLLVYLF